MRDMAKGEGPLETHLWTWSGRYFGTRNDDALWTYSGHLAGRFYLDDIYGAAGGYIGELRDADRLITNLAKKGRSKVPFSIRRRHSRERRGPHVDRGQLRGYEDFPAPEEFA
jgi:hypothetical protein